MDVTLLYVRPEGGGTELDQRISSVVARYAPHVVMRVVGPADLAGEGAALRNLGAYGCPAVLLLRGQAIVAEAIGASLPMRELDRAVRCAVEWPACEPATV